MREGVIAARIAAHAADLVRLGPRALKWEEEMARARAKGDFEAQLKLAMDPERARSILERVKARVPGTCTMCGKFCALKLYGHYFRRKAE